MITASPGAMRNVLASSGVAGPMAVSMVSTSQGSSVSSRKRLSQGMRGARTS
jgi:hypothetical protein